MNTISNNLDERDQEILRRRIIKRDQLTRPRIGDYLLFPSGQLERFSHDWDDSFQTSPDGSFYLPANGHAGFSGGLNPSTPIELMALTSAMLPGKFWFFHHDIAGAGRAVYFDIPVRVYTTTAEYNGFLGKDFQNKLVDALKKQLSVALLSKDNT